MEENCLLSISEAAKYMGVTEKTLRLWDKSGKFPAIKTSGNHRRYALENIQSFLKKECSSKIMTSEFNEYDMAVLDRFYDAAVARWEPTGYLDNETGYNKKVLAQMLTNQANYTDDKEEDFLYDIIVSFFANFAIKDIVRVTALTGPIGMIYCLRHEINDANELISTIHSEETASSIRELKTKIISSKENNGNLFNKELAKLTGKNLSTEITNQLIYNQWEWGETIGLSIFESFKLLEDWTKKDSTLSEFAYKSLDGRMIYKPNFIITSDFGIELLRSHFTRHLNIHTDFIPDKHFKHAGNLHIGNQFDSYKVYYCPQMEGMTIGYAGDSPLLRKYVFSMYVPLFLANFLDDKEKWHMRYAWKSTKSYDGYRGMLMPLYKIVF